MTPDRIEREIFIAAPVERVWEVLTEPEHIAVWFGPGTPSVDLRPGGFMVLEQGEYGSFPTRIEKSIHQAIWPTVGPAAIPASRRRMSIRRWSSSPWSPRVEVPGSP